MGLRMPEIMDVVIKNISAYRKRSKKEIRIFLSSGLKYSFKFMLHLCMSLIINLMLQSVLFPSFGSAGAGFLFSFSSVSNVRDFFEPEPPYQDDEGYQTPLPQDVVDEIKPFVP